MVVTRILHFIKGFFYTRRVNRNKECSIHWKTEIDSSTTFEGNNTIMSGVGLNGCKVGYFSYIGNDTVLFKTDIGRFCSIADNVSIIFGEHPSSGFVSTSPAFYFKSGVGNKSYVNEDYWTGEQTYPHADIEHDRYCIIGNDVWIGKKVLLKSGVKIGDGAIVASGAIVTKDVEPYSIVGGVPAKLIRYRFSKEDIEWLKTLKWWEKDEKWWKNHAEDFQDIKLLQERLKSDEE